MSIVSVAMDIRGNGRKAVLKQGTVTEQRWLEMWGATPYRTNTAAVALCASVQSFSARRALPCSSPNVRGECQAAGARGAVTVRSDRGRGGRTKEVGMENKPAQNIQESFLNTARKERTNITIYLLSGVKLTGRIRSFDKYSVVLETNNQEQLIFKHAISTVATGRSLHATETGRRSMAASAATPSRCG